MPAVLSPRCAQASRRRGGLFLRPHRSRLARREWSVLLSCGLRPEQLGSYLFRFGEYRPYEAPTICLGYEPLRAVQLGIANLRCELFNLTRLPTRRSALLAPAHATNTIR